MLGLARATKKVREHFGLDTSRLVELVYQTLKHLKTTTGDHVTPADVATFLQKIDWATDARNPNERKVRDLLTIGEWLNKAGRAKRAMQ